MNRRDRGKRPLMQLRQSPLPAKLVDDYVARRSLFLLENEPAAAARTRARIEEIARHNSEVWQRATSKSIARHQRRANAAMRRKYRDVWVTRASGVFPPPYVEVLVALEWTGSQSYTVAEWTGEAWRSYDPWALRRPILAWRFIQPLPPPPPPPAGSSRPPAGPGDRSPPPPAP